MIKDKYKTPNTYGSKMLSLRDNRLNILSAIKAIGWNLLMKHTNKHKKELCTITKIVKSSAPLFNVQINKKSKKFRS
jgi:hypothetical protein